MKNTIEYFYNLRPNDIHQNKEEYFFEIDNKYYSLKECNRTPDEINELYNLEQELYSRKIYVHKIILNINNELITYINNKNYILMMIFVSNNDKLTLEDILKINNIRVIGNYQHISRNNWRILWSQKVDYIEYQIEENKYKYKELSTSVDYFIGLVENGIQLLHGMEFNELYLSHQRINSNMRVRDLYDPLNIVLDSKARNISEYFKERLLKTRDVEKELSLFFKNTDLDFNSLKLFFIRSLFMTKYFDIFDSILIHGYDNKENQFNLMLTEIENYEKFLRYIYFELYSRQIIPEIEWLKKQAF